MVCDGRDDAAEFSDIRSAMKVLMMSDQEIWDILKVIWREENTWFSQLMFDFLCKKGAGGPAAHGQHQVQGQGGRQPRRD